MYQGQEAERLGRPSLQVMALELCKSLLRLQVKGQLPKDLRRCQELDPSLREEERPPGCQEYVLQANQKLDCDLKGLVPQQTRFAIARRNVAVLN
mmetsp:Transcript_56988/g.102012  ORF Transcript_56988/g.102012 Transcript_56988/m.102012 type:complete len:95 (-) Transcript_56988:15-299(-)